MKMEEPGPEVAKRQRLEHYGESPPTHRVHEQQPEGPLPLPLHNYTGPPALRPPSAYSRPPPPSPYNPHHDPRGLPEHHQHPGSYDGHHSGYNTPHRERPPPADTNPHHTVPNTSAQSPDRPTGVALRPLNTAFEPGTQHFAHPPGHEGAEPPRPYPPLEQPNGIYHGLPVAQGHIEPGHPPPPPVQHGPPYSAGPYPGHPPAVWTSNRPYQPPPSKKGTRAQQACEMCRQRKARCDEGRPTCTYCKENGTTCIYKEMQAPKADRAQKEIMDQLRKIEDGYDELRTHSKELDAKVDRVEKTLSEIARALQDKDRKEIEAPRTKIESPTMTHNTTHGPVHESSFSSPHQARPELSDLYDKTKPFGNDFSEDVSAGVSIHIDHATGVHRLFKWPLIANLFGRHIPRENYVMENEEKKGLLRIFGKGQGIDRYDGSHGGAASSPASSSGGDDPSRSPGNSSEDDLWGHELGYPLTIDGKFFNNERDHSGGLTYNGSLKLDRATMYELQDSYLANIHILHPFLDRARLRRMVDKVYRDYNPGDQHDIVNPASSSTAVPFSRPLKRKHSNDDQPQAENIATPNNVRTQPKLVRRISTVVVLLVMALGKICLHTGPLPGFAGDVGREAREGQTPSQTTSPDNHTLSPPSVSSPMSAGDMRNLLHHTTSNPESLRSKGSRRLERNVDVIPGLAYFGKALELLGTLQGNDLQFVQANLLASLYTAQLACVIESWTWIQHACRACYFLIRDPGSFGKEKDQKKVDLICFAYWTCLQLESDILAEMDLRPSGIHEHDDKIRLPKGVVDDAADLTNSSGLEDPIIAYYSYQLQLRKWLNLWQKIMYPANRGEQKVKPVDDKFSIFERNACELSLTSFRGLLQRSNAKLAWNDWDEPASDINAARLRGKYYGAKYIVHRPFLYHALHHFDGSHLNEEVMKLFRNFDQNPSAAFNQDDPPPGSTKQARADWLIAQTLLSCRLCIEAAKRSTVAFDGVLKSKRLMITNVFGTVHAQFGNMLVLAATFTSKHLSWLIQRDELLQLLNRTIQFLQAHAPISTTLAADARFLTTIKNKIEVPRPVGSEIAHPTSSFGSISSR